MGFRAAERCHPFASPGKEIFRRASERTEASVRAQAPLQSTHERGTDPR